MQVGVISDTHGLLRPEALERLRGVAHILHAGDIGAPGLIEALEEIAPVTAIRGNVDTGAWAQRFPDTCDLDLGGHRIHMLHDRKALDLDPAERGLGIVVSGHSHKPLVERAGGVLFLNPGSAGRRRFRLPVTLAMLALADGPPEARIFELL